MEVQKLPRRAVGPTKAGGGAGQNLVSYLHWKATSQNGLN